MSDNMQECKVFLPLDYTREQAESFFAKYGATVEGFMSRREVGCNEVTYAVVTISVKLAAKLVDDRVVARVDVLTTFRSAKTCAEECGCSPSG